MPAGVPGELVIGGPVLARGYRGRPGLTAEKFVPDPLSGALGRARQSGGAPGARLYRTGDLARQRLGRGDRVPGPDRPPGQDPRLPGGAGGDRVGCSPGIPAVQSAAVIDADERGGKRLVAYWCRAPRPRRPGAGGVPGREAARLHGALGLRDLEALPLTTSGKVDRRALPAAEPAAEAAAMPPPARRRSTRSPRCWPGSGRSFWGSTRVGAGDDFFDLGGHSLLATQLVSRVRSAFGVELEVKELFEEPTLAGFARRDRVGAAAAARFREAPPLVPAPRDREPAALLRAGAALVPRTARAGRGGLPHSAAMRLAGPLDVAALAASLGEIVRRHEALRTRFADGGRPGGRR